MAKIVKVIGMEIKEKDGEQYGIVHVIMEDGLECTVFVGGNCETWHYKGTNGAFVQKKNTIDKVTSV